MSLQCSTRLTQATRPPPSPTGCFALYSGLAFLAVTALGLTPVFHWVLHRFHWEWTRDER